jgi:hypothetical protein
MSLAFAEGSTDTLCAPVFESARDQLESVTVDVVSVGGRASHVALNKS